jgi:hypothetical protein
MIQSIGHQIPLQNGKLEMQFKSHMTQKKCRNPGKKLFVYVLDDCSDKWQTLRHRRGEFQQLGRF